MDATVKIKPFRFMDLPKELRLMVYERTPCSIVSNEVTNRVEQNRLYPEQCFTLISRGVSVNILATCKTVHAEAHAIIMKLAQSWILNVPPRVIVDSTVQMLIAWKLLADLMYPDQAESGLFTQPSFRNKFFVQNFIKCMTFGTRMIEMAIITSGGVTFTRNVIPGLLYYVDNKMREHGDVKVNVVAYLHEDRVDPSKLVVAAMDKDESERMQGTLSTCTCFSMGKAITTEAFHDEWLGQEVSRLPPNDGCLKGYQRRN